MPYDEEELEELTPVIEHEKGEEALPVRNGMTPEERAVFYAQQNPKGLVKEVEKIAEQSGGAKTFNAIIYVSDADDEIIMDDPEYPTTPASEVLQHCEAGEDVVIKVMIVGEKGAFEYGRTLYYRGEEFSYFFLGFNVQRMFNIIVGIDSYSLIKGPYFVTNAMIGVANGTRFVVYETGGGMEVDIAECYCEITGETSSQSAETIYRAYNQIGRPVRLVKKIPTHTPGSYTYEPLELVSVYRDEEVQQNPPTVVFVEKTYSDNTVTYTRYKIVGTTVTQIV